MLSAIRTPIDPRVRDLVSAIEVDRIFVSVAILLPHEVAEIETTIAQRITELEMLTAVGQTAAA